MKSWSANWFPTTIAGEEVVGNHRNYHSGSNRSAGRRGEGIPSGDWRHYGGQRFDWSQNEKLVHNWFPTTSSPTVVEVVDAHRRVLYRSKTLDDDFLMGLPVGYHSITHHGTFWRVGVFEKDGLTLRIGGDLREVNELATASAMTYFVMMPIIMICVLVGGRFIARKALFPIQEIADFAEHITAQGLGQRIPVPPARDEIHRLSTVLNDTFDRLEKSFHQATRFSADASHELKTPLTVLRTSVEALLRSPRLDLEIEQGLSSILEDTKRLSAITESLLLLSRADAGKLQLDLQPGDLVELVALCADDAGILFEEPGIELERELPPTAPALLDRTRLSQVLMNLLDNALKYSISSPGACALPSSRRTPTVAGPRSQHRPRHSQGIRATTLHPFFPGRTFQ